MLVFAVESSCDETSVCIMNKDKKILSHIVNSQEIHKKYGGVVPELASRAHLEILQNITIKALNEAGLKINDIDIFAATCGPGLIGGLLVGSTYTKSLSIGNAKPFIPVNHLEAHVLSTFYNNEISFPHLCLLITGGHTQIYFLENLKTINLIGQTVDDAVGEAFDKVAKILGLPYPGGYEIEQKALNGNENSFILPEPLIKQDNLNFSFSGLKTSVNLISKKNNIDEDFVKNISASFQKTVSNILIKKIDRAVKNIEIDKNKNFTISVVGGVANNNYLRKCFKKFENENNLKFLFPPKYMLNDNASMVAWTAIFKYSKINDINFKPDPRLSIS